MCLSITLAPCLRLVADAFAQAAEKYGEIAIFRLFFQQAHQLRSTQANGLRRSHARMPASNGNLVTPDSPGSSSRDSSLPPPWGDTAVDEQGNPIENPLPPHVHVLAPTPQTRCLHTLLRDKTTNQDEFIFYAERLMRPLCEFACRLLPYEVCDWLFIILPPPCWVFT